MATKSVGDKPDEALLLIAGQEERLNAIEKELGNIKDMLAVHAQFADTLAEHSTILKTIQQRLDDFGAPTDLHVKIAVLEKQVDSLNRTRENWINRLWAIAGPVVGAIVGIILGYLLKS